MNIKNIIIKTLNFIRRILTGIKLHGLPSTPSFSHYNTYVVEQKKKSYETFKQYYQKSIFVKREDYHKYIIERAKKNDPLTKKFYLEFGVFEGTSINFFSKYVNTIYGFDSFEGLREDWAGTTKAKNSYSTNKKLPKLNKNIVPVIGWVQDSLAPFLDEHKPEINFVHMDMDTYESTKFALEKIKPYLSKNCIIAFDELCDYSGWEVGEYKALKETFNDNEYKYICFMIDGEKAAIQIL